MSTNVKAEMEQLIAAYSEMEGPSVKRPLTSEIKRFVSYLLASNGKISDGEAEFLGSLLGREITSEELTNYITAENIFSKEFSETIPNVFKRNIHNIAAGARCNSLNSRSCLRIEIIEKWRKDALWIRQQNLLFLSQRTEGIIGFLNLFVNLSLLLSCHLLQCIHCG